MTEELRDTMYLLQSIAADPNLFESLRTRANDILLAELLIFPDKPKEKEGE